MSGPARRAARSFRVRAGAAVGSGDAGRGGTADLFAAGHLERSAVADVGQLRHAYAREVKLAALDLRNAVATDIQQLYANSDGDPPLSRWPISRPVWPVPSMRQPCNFRARRHSYRRPATVSCQRFRNRSWDRARIAFRRRLTRSVQSAREYDDGQGICSRHSAA